MTEIRTVDIARYWNYAPVGQYEIVVDILKNARFLYSITMNKINEFIDHRSRYCQVIIISDVVPWNAAAMAACQGMLPSEHVSCPDV